MCGICGIVHQDPSYPVREERLTAMRDRMTHRGPDDAGNYLAPGVGLGSRRLAIQDLSPRGHMPMASPDGRYHIAYNGEVYNFHPLRRELEGQGVAFRSGTDTEVILWLYLREGPKMLERLSGMFAFAIWDARERSLFVARDRLGVKPFYYAWHDGALHFASEQKALFAAGVPAAFDHTKWEELLCFRFVAGEDTPFVGVKSLLPGHYLTLKDGALSIRRWWNLAERSKTRVLSGDLVAQVRQTFDASIALRRISDVPVGVFLSGGLDSSSVAAALALQAGRGVHSYTMGFDQAEFDERPFAAELAQRYALDHHVFKVPEGSLLPMLERASWFNDEPLAHGHDVHLNVIATRAKREVTVLLSGEGADEILGGYVRYRPLRFPGLLTASAAWLPAVVGALKLRGRLRKLARFLQLGSIDDFILYNPCNVFPSDLGEIGLEAKGDFPFRRAMLEEAKRYSPEPARQVMYLDQHTYLVSLLHRNDRMTMAASIECREPLLDTDLVEIAAALPTRCLFGEGQGKWILRQAMADRLPASIVKHHKWGFGVPWADYLRTDPALRQFLEELPDKPAIAAGPFDRRGLRQVTARFLAGDNQRLSLLLQLMMVALWHEVALQERYRPSSRLEQNFADAV